MKKRIKELRKLNKKNVEKIQRIKKKSLIRNKKKAELFDILDSINDTNLKKLKLTRKKAERFKDKSTLMRYIQNGRFKNHRVVYKIHYRRSNGDTRWAHKTFIVNGFVAK